MKPILLLDVDGVINVPRKKRTRAVYVYPKIGGKTFRLRFWPTNRTARFMRLVWSAFDVRWLTAWGNGADVIAKRYGLNQRPEIDWRRQGSKAAGAAAALRDFKGPVFWIEDGIDDEAKALIAKRGWTYLHCDPFVGVTGAHMKALKAFALES
jgi:hypothetical protein